MLHPPALWMQQLLPAMKSSFNSEVSSREKLIFFSLSYISCTLSSKETLYFLSLQNNQHNSLPQLAAGKEAWNKKAEAYKSQTPIFHYWKLQTELPFTSLLSVHHDQHLKLSPVTTVSLLEVCILPWKYQCQATPGKEKSGFSRSQCKEWAYYCCLLGLHNNNLAVMLLQPELVAGVYFCM